MANPKFEDTVEIAEAPADVPKFEDTLDIEATDTPSFDDTLPVESETSEPDYEEARKARLAELAEQERQALAEEERIAQEEAEKNDPKNWSSERFAKETPPPQTIEEKALYDSTLARKQAEERRLSEKLPLEVKKKVIQIDGQRAMDSPLAKGALEVAMAGPVSPGIVEMQAAPGRAILAPYLELAKQGAFQVAGVAALPFVEPEVFDEIDNKIGNAFLGYTSPGTEIVKETMGPLEDAPAFAFTQAGPIGSLVSVLEATGIMRPEKMGSSAGANMIGTQLDLMSSPNVLKLLEYPLQVRYKLATEIFDEIGKTVKAKGGKVVVDEGNFMRWAESKNPGELRRILGDLKTGKYAKKEKIGQETGMTTQGAPEMTPAEPVTGMQPGTEVASRKDIAALKSDPVPVFEETQPVESVDPRESEAAALVNPEEGKSALDTVLDMIRGEINEGEPGYRFVNQNEYGETIAGATPSTYPEYFKNKGYTKKYTLAILDRVKAGKKITEKQRAILDDLLDGKIEALKKEVARYERELSEADEGKPAAANPPEEGSRGEEAQSGAAREEVPQSEIVEPDGEVDLTFEFEEAPPKKPEPQPDMFGGEKSYRKPEFGENKEIKPQQETATPLQEKAQEEKQEKIFETKKGRGKYSGEGFYSEAGSPKSGQADLNPEDLTAKLHKKLGGMEYIKPVEAPELLKIAVTLTGRDVELTDRFSAALGKFIHVDGLTSYIKLLKTIFKNPQLTQGVLAHEIGHLFDWLPHQTLKRGNILGRLGVLLNYRRKFLPESPGAAGPLTDADRRRFKKLAEKLAIEKAGGQKKMFEKEELPENVFDPDMVLGIWNKVEGNVPEELMDYVKALDTQQKKQIIKAAFEAKKKGEMLTIDGVRKLNAEYKKDPEGFKDIYEDLIRQEIKKRKLWEEEQIKEELKALTKWWHPFDSSIDPSYTKYRHSARELYAEFISVLLNAPGKAQELAPNTFKAFFNYIDKKPAVFDSLLKVQAMIQGSNDELFRVREQDIKGMFKRGEEMFRARQVRYEAAKRSLWFYVKNALWNKNQALLEDVTKLQKTYPGINKEAIENDLETRDFTSSVVRSYMEKIEPVHRQIMDEKLRDDIGLFMFAKRIAGDRAEYANPLAHNPKTATDQLDYMKRTDPDRYAKVEGLVSKIQSWLKAEIVPLMEDVYKPEHMKTALSNADYAPFRVLDFMKDYVSAGMIRQEGTLRDIANPYDSLLMKAVSMVRSAIRNEGIKRNGNFVSKYPKEFNVKPARITEYPGVFKIQDPPDRTQETIAWRERGQWQAYHVDRHVADVINGTPHSAAELIRRTAEFMDKIFLNNSVFRPLWITFNLNFQAANFVRDLMSTWKAHPDFSLPKVIKYYGKAFPHAVARVKNQLDPVINEMYKHAALGVTFNDLILGQTDEDLEIEKLMQSLDLSSKKGVKWDNVPVIKYLVKAADAVRSAGDVIETLPKVAGWMGLENASPEERAMTVRNLVGTPNFKKKGVLTPISNSIFLFSNIQARGMERLFKLASGAKTRKSYWKRTAFANIVPKILLLAAAAGILGPKAKDLVDKQTEYIKTNYTVIPVGYAGNKSAAITLPQDEEGKFISGLFWKIANSAIKDGSLDLKDLQDIFSYAGQQGANLSPGIKLWTGWAEFLSGRSPRDDYRGNDIVYEENMKAGGMYAFKPMLLWTINQTGMTRFTTFEQPNNETISEKILAMTPIAQRFIRISDYGIGEKYKAISKKVESEQAKRRLDFKTDIAKGEAAPRNKAELKKIQKMEKRNEARTDSMLTRTVAGASSNEAKLAILAEGQKEFTSKEDYRKYLGRIYQLKVISGPVLKMALSAWAEK